MATQNLSKIKRKRRLSEYQYLLPFSQVLSYFYLLGVKGDWDLRISDLVKNPVGTDTKHV